MEYITEPVGRLDKRANVDSGLRLHYSDMGMACRRGLEIAELRLQLI